MRSLVINLEHGLRATRPRIGIGSRARGVLLRLLGLLLFASPMLGAEPAPGVGVLELVAPERSENALVTYQPAGGREVPARRRTPLHPGDVIATREGGAAIIRWQDQSTTRLGEGSRLVVVEAEPGFWARLVRGAFYFLSREAPMNRRFRTDTVVFGHLGTDFVVRVGDADTVITLLDGEVEASRIDAGPGAWSVRLTNRLSQASFGRGAGAPLVLPATNLVQWWLYYPIVVVPDDLSFSPGEKRALDPSLVAYQTGDIRAAAEAYPPGRVAESDAERVYRAALWLALGNAANAREELTATAPTAPAADALRTLMATVEGAPRPSAAPPTTASAWLAQSYWLQGQHRLTDAWEAAQQAARLQPGFGPAHLRVAELEFGFGRTKAAARELDEARRLAPRHAQAQAMAGFVLAAGHRIHEAEAAFDAAIALDPLLGNAWLGRGLCRIRQGEANGGLLDLRLAATLEPTRALLRSYFGKGLDQAGHPREARAELDLAKNLDPADPTAWLYAALLDRQDNRINEAVVDLETSIQKNDNRRLYRSRLLLDQDRAVRSANLARIYAEAGLDDVALQEAQRAVQFDYANYAAHLFLANAFDGWRDPGQITLRYETPWLNEYLLANLLAPAAAGILSPLISQHEYGGLFERNRLGLVSTTDYQGGRWQQGGSQFGTFGNASYALEAGYRFDPGDEPNTDFEQLTFAARYHQNLTPHDGLYFQAVDYRAEAGDVRASYDPAAVSPTLRTLERQEPLLFLGYHHEWQPGLHTLALAGRLADRVTVNDTNAPAILLGVSTNGTSTYAQPYVDLLNLNYESEFTIYTGELQQLIESERYTGIVGVRYQHGEFDTRNRQNQRFGPTDLYVEPPADQQIQADFERLTAYGYAHWQVARPIRLIAGLAYDAMTYPENHRFVPLATGTETHDQVSPKAGLVWTPTESTTIRAAVTRALGGVSFDQSFQLEPSQVAGFVQSFRSLIPESLKGANAAPTFDSAGLSLDQHWPTHTYVGANFQVLASEVDRTLGYFQSISLLPDPTPFAPASMAESLRFKERTLNAYANQLLGESFSFGVRYRLSQAELEDSLPLLPGAYSGSDLTSTIHQLDLFALFQHSSGFFVRLDGHWTAQHNRGFSAARGEADQPGDSFWQCDVMAGYRLFRRRIEISAGILNLTDQDYRLSPLNLYALPPRERTVAVRLRLSF